jgi:ketosteroid isomerase-like protein
MSDHDRLIVEALYVAWEAGELEAMLRNVADGIAFAVHPPGTRSFIGRGHGKALLNERLQAFLREYAVIDYNTPPLSSCNGVVDCRVAYHYRHRKTGMTIDGNMRHIWHVVSGKIARFDVIHDAKRMGAFFELADGALP